MAKSYIERERLLSTRDLLMTGVTIVLLSLLLIAAFLPPTTMVMARYPNSLFADFAKFMVTCGFSFLTSAIILSADRRRIATWRRASIVALGAGGTIAVFASVPCAITLIAGGLPRVSLIGGFLAFEAVIYVFVMSCWGLIQILYGPVVVVDKDTCVSCGYSLIGTESGRCPECGTVFEIESITEKSGAGDSAMLESADANL